MNYYDILDVPKDASADVIKKQYKKKALKHHPDRGGNSEMFKKISEAYQTLSDPEKKQEYDNTNPFSQNMPTTGANFHHHRQQPHFVDPNIIFQHFFNNNFFQQPPQHVQHPQARNTTTFNIRTSSMGGYQKSVSTQIHGDTKIETTTEIKNGVKTQTVKQTNTKTGETVTNVNHQIASR